MTHLGRTLFGLTTVALLIAGPIVLAMHQDAQMRNFRVVREGVLYRSGQMTVAGLRRAAHDHGIRTVISLRDPIDGPAGAPGRAEEEFCNREEIRYVRLSPRSWYLQDGTAPVDANVKQFVELMGKQENLPVLIHCFAGIHRTGAYCAIYRMAMEGWDNDRAIEELKACGYENLDAELDIREYLEQFRQRQANGSRPANK